MTQEENRQLEKQIIHLMLVDRTAISAVAESPNQLSHFDALHQPLIEALYESESKRVELTRFSYNLFLEQRHFDKQDKIALTLLFQECRNSIAGVTINDLPALLEKKHVAFLETRTFSLLEEFSKNKNKDIVFAAKELVERLGGALAEAGADEHVTFNDITSDEFWQQYDAEHQKKMLDDNPVTDCGIPEFDQVMGVGLDPETLTLICADVAGFKCQRASAIVCLADGSIDTIGSLWKRYSLGEQIKLWSLDDDTGQLYGQPLISVQDNGIRPTVKVTTRLGLDSTTTANHKHLTFNGYAAVSSLRIGDHVAIPRRMPFGVLQPLPHMPTWLGCMIAEGGCTNPCYSFTNFDASIVRAMTHACHNISTPIGVIKTRGIVVRGQHRVRQCRNIGEQYGIDGKLAIHKTIHPSVFGWHKDALVELLRAMYGCDGGFSVELMTQNNGSIFPRFRVLYCTSSHQLAKDVQFLLLKFGLVASIFEFESHFNGSKSRPAYRVILQDARQVERFIKDIGFLGKKQAIAEEHLHTIEGMQENGNFDLIPGDVWQIIARKLKEQNKSFYGCRRWMVRPDGKSGRGFEGSCGTWGKSINRFLLRKIATYLDNDLDLIRICDAELYWDTIVSIEDAGVEQVFDITMPNDHNYVADNIVTHNSTTMLNIALNVWQRHKKDVLFVGLEMPRNRLMDKIVSRECRIPFDHLQRPKNVMTAEQWAQVEAKRHALQGEAGNGRFVLLEYGKRTTVAQIRQQIDKHLSHFHPCVVVIDYIANLEPDAGNRRKERNDLEIGDMLKSLLKMGKPGSVSKEGFGVVSGAQLNRDALKRMKNYRGDTTKFFFSSDDIQGSHQYSADATSIFCLYADPANKTRIFVFPVKNRYGKITYSDGSNKAALEVQPEFNLIRSPNDAVWKSDADDSLLVKGVTPPEISDPWADIEEPPLKRDSETVVEWEGNNANNNAPKPARQRLGDDIDSWLN